MSRHPKPVAAPAPAPLTPNELRLVDLFRRMDSQGKFEIIASAQHRADNYPGRPRPKLRLVDGGPFQ